MFLPGIERHANLRQLDVENRRRSPYRDRCDRPARPGSTPRAARRPRCASAGARRECRRSTGCRPGRRRESPCDGAAARVRARSGRRVPRRRAMTRSSATSRWPRSTRSSTHSDLPMPLLPDEQQPDAEHVGERAVQVRRRRELLLEPRLDPRVELVRLERASESARRRRPPRARRDLGRGSCPFVMNTHGNRKREERRRDARDASSGSSDLRYVISVSPSTCRRRAGNRST